MAKRFIRIQSTKTIMVAPGLQVINVTNKDAHIENRLKVNSVWQNARVKIMSGVAYYPSCIKDWPSVKKLADLSILSISEETNDIKDEGMKIAAEALERKLVAADARYKTMLENTDRDPLVDTKEKKRNKVKKELGLLKPESEELKRDEIGFDEVEA